MKTYEFNSERNWNKCYDALDSENRWEHNFCSYGYKAITVFDETTDKFLLNFCKEHRIAIKEI